MKSIESSPPMRLSGRNVIGARLDGNAFHKWTRNLDRPFSGELDELRRESLLVLMKESGAVAGYCQSDELSLLWRYPDEKSQPYFGGKLLKMTSILASTLTAVWNDHARLILPNQGLARFDCRVFEFPTEADAVLYILWRQRDCWRNAVTMAAQSVFSHRELLGVNSDQKIAMLAEKGIDFEDYAWRLRWGSFFNRRTMTGRFTLEEIQDLPPMHNARRDPNAVFERSLLREINLPPVNLVANAFDVLFNGHEPVLVGEAFEE